MGTLWSLLIMAGVVGLFGYFAIRATGFVPVRRWRSALLLLGLPDRGRKHRILVASSNLLSGPTGMQLESTFSDCWNIRNRKQIYSIIATGVLVFLLTAIMTINLATVFSRIVQTFPAQPLAWIFIGGFEGVPVVLLLLGGMVSIQKVNAERLRERIPPTGRAKLDRHP